ncbi:MAG: J domain-containing protein [Oscillospiraceae bacterium]|nr:J domain-containing protein [Oscillospiraceae bacterium]
MNDPYETLGVARTASDDEIKKTYRELARKYHPDNYVNNPLADLAQEKMKEINEAYDAIEKERAGGGAYQYQTWANPAGYSSSASGTAAGPLADARAAINSGDLSRAEMILGSIVDRNAEWNFLMGMLCFRRGWMDDASRYFRVSATMDPTNPEYRQAVSYMETVGRQPRTTVVRSSDPDYCSICTNLMVADCCCEMMGGDLIRCI